MSYWFGYVNACRELAAENGVTLRVLDKALWHYSKQLGRAQDPRAAEAVTLRGWASAARLASMP